ncbi:MAG: pentapeptide repeat-containing protein [Microcoleaceae cyanobacterium MO_207.B10]|nr:pentapeptide repeat-containing protein [Microcoleaceae cyanobacterium MO_207.B10]
MPNKSCLFAILGFFAGAGTIIAVIATLIYFDEKKSDLESNLKKIQKTGECINCNLVGINLAGSSSLAGANLAWSNLSNANLQDADLRAINFSKANLNGTNLQGAILREAFLSNANLSNANLKYADLSSPATYLEAANLTKANLQGANLFRTNLSNANLNSTILRQANLTGANLKNANLSNADFSSLTNSYPTQIPTYLDEADLTNANINNAKLEGARMCQTIMPDGTISQQGCFSPSENLRYWLAAQKWQEAEVETNTIILKALNREKEGWVEPKQIEKIPCQDIKSIDKIWLNSSNGKFGLSIQKSFWESQEINQDYGRFANKVGWVINKSWLKFNDLNFSSNAPSGHLPWNGWQVQLPTNEEPTRFRRVGFGVWMSKLAQCGL